MAEETRDRIWFEKPNYIAKFAVAKRDTTSNTIQKLGCIAILHWQKEPDDWYNLWEQIIFGFALAKETRKQVQFESSNRIKFKKKKRDPALNAILKTELH